MAASVVHTCNASALMGKDELGLAWAVQQDFVLKF